MNADLILDAFEKIDDKYIIEAKEHRLMAVSYTHLTLPTIA